MLNSRDEAYLTRSVLKSKLGIVALYYDTYILHVVLSTRKLLQGIARCPCSVATARNADCIVLQQGTIMFGISYYTTDRADLKLVAPYSCNRLILSAGAELHDARSPISKSEL